MKDRGFSLIELVVVLALISLSISLVVPSFARLSKRIEMKAAAQKISGILRYYRSEAVQKGKIQRVIFDAEMREVRVPTTEPGEDRGEEGKQEEKIVEKKYPLPEGIQIREVKIPSAENPSDVPTIEFYPNGSSSGGSILLESQSQKSYRILVHFLTGIVTIEEI